MSEKEFDSSINNYNETKKVKDKMLKKKCI